MTDVNGYIASLCQPCLRLLRRVNDTISHPSHGLDPSPKREADHMRSLCYVQSSFKEMASAASAGCRICRMAQAQIQGGQFTALTWSDHDGPRPGDDLMGRTDKGLLLSRPFESDGLVSIRFYVDLSDEARVMFAYLDRVLWLSPPARGLIGAELRSSRLPLCLTRR